MKIEIDLNDILGGGDEFAPENLQESIRRQVIEKMTHEIRQGISEKIDTKISQAIDASIKESLKEITPKLINELMDTQYVQVDTWGSRKGPTTFREQVVKAINEQMVYQKAQYSSDNNAFTSAVDGVIKTNMEAFKKEFDSLVHKGFAAETMDYAVATLKKKLGIQ